MASASFSKPSSICGVTGQRQSVDARGIRTRGNRKIQRFNGLAAFGFDLGEAQEDVSFLVDLIDGRLHRAALEIGVIAQRRFDLSTSRRVESAHDAAQFRDAHHVFAFEFPAFGELVEADGVGRAHLHDLLQPEAEKLPFYLEQIRLQVARNLDGESSLARWR